MKIARALNWKYALGELLIVVVGILAAVQIDGWTGDRRQAARADEYLERLRGDLRADSLNLEERISDSRTSVDAAQRMLAAMEEPVPPDDVVFLLSQLRSISFFEPRVATYQDLVSTGQLGLIKDVDFRDRLVQYNEVQNGDWLRAWSGHLRLNHWEEWADNLAYHVDLRRLGEQVMDAVGPDDAELPLFLTSWDAFRTDPEVTRRAQNVWAVSEASIDDYEERRDAVSALLDYTR